MEVLQHRHGHGEAFDHAAQIAVAGDDLDRCALGEPRLRAEVDRALVHHDDLLGASRESLGDLGLYWLLLVLLVVRVIAGAATARARDQSDLGADLHDHSVGQRLVEVDEQQAAFALVVRVATAVVAVERFAGVEVRLVQGQVGLGLAHAIVLRRVHADTPLLGLLLAEEELAHTALLAKRLKHGVETFAIDAATAVEEEHQIVACAHLVRLRIWPCGQGAGGGGYR